MPLLSAQDLSLGYDGGVILSGLSFDVNKGDCLFIVGENGSGKSTLMKTILGLTPPAGGRIVTGEGLGAGEIGYLPQQTPVQKDFPASVREIVLSGCQGRLGWRPFYPPAEKRRALDAMRRLSVEPLADKSFRDLSGGQKQRVLLARALCAADKLLLLDEPVAGLDPVAAAELYRQIEALNRDGITIVMVSHDIPAALRYASHILHIGREVFFGTAGEYRQSAAAREFLAAEKEAAHVD